MPIKQLPTSFQFPDRMGVDHSSLTDSYGKFYVQAFERGFGTTVGVLLKRALIMAFEGAAITAVNIQTGENDLIEDDSEIILNLRQIRFKLNVAEPKPLIIFTDKPGELTSADINTDGDLDILDRTVHIATVRPGGKINIAAQIRNGRGYSSSDMNGDGADGFLPIDSVYTPIRKVNYSVEPTRQGSVIGFEKLILEVWTDGSVRPEESVRAAAKIIRDQLAFFVNFEEEEYIPPKIRSELEKPSHTDEVLDHLIKDFNLSVRSLNCLAQLNIVTVRDLARLKEEDLRGARSLGKKSLDEICELLAELNLEFGMKFDEESDS